MRKGFTLIEVLIVVLIIAILAAIALPQYQKSKEKTIAGEALSNIRALERALQSYYLATGNYILADVNNTSRPEIFEQLDVKMPQQNESYYGYRIDCSGVNCYLKAQRRAQKGASTYAPYNTVPALNYCLLINVKQPQNIKCVHYADNSDAQKTCISIVGAEYTTAGGY